ncbi:hypothetical protein [Paraflavitalea speifideaquila]|uniref:hypothetical protein n=1 Tax=Paraflavitalea speifideaquila TaxID=3076558 RepID=UPI0028EBA786|nr:hypothetical protein [Paraflavitalea speifideiaquila]
MGDAVNERFALARTINERIDEQKANEYLDYFPAVWMWTVSYTNDYAGKLVADACRKRNRTFMGAAFNDFYTSKLLKRGTWDMFHYASEAVSAGIGKVERKYIATGLSWNFRKMLEFGIAEDVSIMNIITWNDYPEGHHLAPEINHNDGFSLLLKYYKSVWKKNLFHTKPMILPLPSLRSTGMISIRRLIIYPWKVFSRMPCNAKKRTPLKW